MKARALLIVAGIGLGAAPGAGAQVSVTVSRWLPAPHLSDYRLGVGRTALGAAGLLPQVQILTGGAGVTKLGVGLDLAIRPQASGRAFLIAGLSGGLMDFDQAEVLDLWTSWSVGVGAELARLGPLGAVAIETRYQSLGDRSARGVSIGLRLGSRVTRGSATRRGTAASAVEFAIGAMGTPYLWGGTDANGFDCSGLIQSAYGRAGLSLPRRSVDQAAAGSEVGRTGSALRPGDILVFSGEPGGGVSHVGLYVGNGNFIHSTARGVRISGLSPTDPAGKWWFQRWISTRRVAD